MTQPFLIADTKIGIERDLEPWLLPNDAYPDLQDCYIWRGGVHKRQGYQFLGRLQRIVAPISMGASTVTFTLTDISLIPGLSSFTIGTVTFMDNGVGGFFQTDAGVGSAIDYTTGVVTLNLAAPAPSNLSVNYFPGLPVMGLRDLETLTENEDSLIAFDPSFSYLFSGGMFQDLTFYKGSDAPFIWHGMDFDLFWTNNYLRAMFATNGPGSTTDVHNFLDGAPYTTLTAGSPTTTIQVTGVDVTALFVAGDFVFIYPNSTTTTFPPVGTTTEFQGSGIITSSTVVGGNTIILVTVATTTNSGTGTIFNLSRNIGNGTSVGDTVKWLDQDKSGWVNFQPPLNGAGVATNYLQSCEMIFPYKGRLVILNTLEGPLTGSPNHFYQRARWSQAATVYYSNPLPTNYTGGADPQAWRDDVIGKGGFIDAPTLEQIVSAEYVKDSLIVYFERSTWQLRFTGNDLLPFVWEKINTELGAESTFSVVAFDKIAIAMGDVGFHACDTVNVQRIDAKMPDEVFNVQSTNNGPQRVFGIRDYFYELVYWTVPYSGINTIQGAGTASAFKFPNKLFVYNYVDKAFSFFNDSFTCFGYYQAANAITWASENILWGDMDVLWSDHEVDNAFTTNIIAGNQQGFVELMMQQSSNDVSLFIGNIVGNTITCPNHNLQENMYIKVVSASGITSGVGIIYKVITIVDPNNFMVDQSLIGTFTGSGTLSIVNNFSIMTKKFNPFIAEANQVRLVKTDIFMDRTANGQVTINLFINDDINSTPINQSNIPISSVSAPITAITLANPCVVTVQPAIPVSINDVLFIAGVGGTTQVNGMSSFVTGITPIVNGLQLALAFNSSAYSAYISGGTLYNVSKNTGNVVNTFPESTYSASPDTNLVNAKLWKRIYFEDISQFFQFQFTFSDTQMRCDPISAEDVVLHGLVLYFSQSGRLIDV